MSKNEHRFNDDNNHRRDNRDFGDHSPNGGGFRPPRAIEIVKGSRNNAMTILKISPDEQTAFVTYLNYAVNNVCEVAGVEFSDERKVRGALYKGEPAAIQRRLQKLADFLWAFREKDPSADEAGYKAKLGNGHEDMAAWVAERIVALRNLFSHVNCPDCEPQLVMSHSEYVFVEGVLGGAARDAAMGPGLNPAKAQKLKLATFHVKDDHTYEFTRKGLIFMTCLGLYKDEAEEFCHLFGEMKVPDRIDDADLDEEFEDGRRRRVLGAEDVKEFTGLKDKGRALIELFTFYSYRRGRQSLDAANLDFMQFADIVGCLNKVPAPVYDFMPLEKERAELSALAAASTEDDAKKRTKYVFRRRDRNRFLSFAAAYCEDFDVLPSIKFKRLDVRQTTGRHQYVFGADEDEASGGEEGNRVRLNRHYVINRDAIAFEFVPDQHYGPVRIGSIRSAISASEMRRLLYLHAQDANGGKSADNAVKAYFTAYHRVLERMVNAGSLAEISLDDETYLADFATICGTTPEKFKADPAAFRPFVFECLRRYFTKESGVRTDTELLERLRAKLWAAYDRTYDILTRHDNLEEWRKASRPWLDAMDEWRGRIDVFRKANPERPLPENLKTIEAYVATMPPAKRPFRPEDPRCRIGDGDGEVSNPPTWCKFSDADYVSYVFDYLNLHLPNDRKFRQLPISEQHREGVEDHLFQMVHTAIGKFSLDQKGLWSLLEKQRPELAGCIGPLKRELNKAEASKPKKNGRRSSATLEDLAVVAVTLTNGLFQNEKEKWDAASLESVSREKLLDACRRFGVRPGMPVERKSLLKTVLGIDYDRWIHAFDYATGKPYADRRLEDEEHVAARIPLPNGFSDRLAEQLPRKLKTAFSKTAPDGTGAMFDYNAAFRAWSPDPTVSLRDYYDTKPLVQAFLAKKKGADAKPAGGSALASLELRKLDALIREIKDLENQDKVLLFVAMKYWERFRGGDTYATGKLKMPFSEKTTLREFFDTPVEIAKDGLAVSLRPNDVNRPSFATLFGNSRAAKDYRAQIASILSPDGSRRAFDFYEMVVAFREQKARDRHERLAFTPYVVNFDAKCTISGSEYERVSAGLEGAAKSEAIRAMEFGKYHAVLPALTRGDYDIVADTRNAVFHTGFRLDCSKAIAICKRLGISGTFPGGGNACGNRPGGPKPRFSRDFHHRPNYHDRW